jgi:hypothetical protein
MVVMGLMSGGKKRKKKEEGLGVQPPEERGLTPQSIIDPADRVRSNVQEAGGFINAGGEFVPPTTPTTKVDFRPDGTVGYTTKDGQSYNLTKDEYNVLIGRPGQFTQNVAEIKAFEGGALRQAEMQDIASRIGAEPQAQQGMAQQGQQPMGETTPIDNAQVWAQFRDPANLRNIVVAGGVGAWAGAKVGGIAGTFVAGPAGTAVGGAIGGVVGAIGGVALETWRVVDKNIKDQRVDNIKAQLSINKDSQTYKNQLATLANVDPQNAETYLNAWIEIDGKQRAAWAQLQIDSRTDLNLRLGEDATRELQRFENYYEGGGYLTQRAKMEKAIFAPDFTEGVYGLMMADMMIGGEE